MSNGTVEEKWMVVRDVKGVVVEYVERDKSGAVEGMMLCLCA